MISEAIEHWDDLGVTVIFTQEYDYTIDFYAVEIAAIDIRGPGDFVAERGWVPKGADSSLDLIFDPHEAERYVAGSVKWDGCQNTHFGDDDGYMHICGPEGVERLSKFLVRVFNRCGELLGDKVLDGVFPVKEHV